MGSVIVRLISKYSIICILFIVVLFLFLSTTSAESEYDLEIESNFRYLFDTGGGEITITVQGSLARDIREDILQDLNITIPNASITEQIKNQYVEATEDIMEQNIAIQRKLVDQNPEDAKVNYKGNYKFIEVDRVDIKSVKGLVGTNNLNSEKIQIKMDIKGPLLKDSEIILSDGYIILYALWGEYIPLNTVKVKETSQIVIIGMNSYSDQDLAAGGEVTKYRILMGEVIEYKGNYKLNGYDLDKGKTDIVSTKGFNFLQNSLLLFIIIIIFTIIAKMVANSIINKYSVNKVLIVSILGVLLFIILLLIYFLGIDGMIVWILSILFFIFNMIMIIGVYQKGWGNLTKVTVRHEDFLKEPPKIDQGPWHERGIANAKVGNFSEAVNCFENALESEPDNPIIWNDLGFAHRKLGNYRQAIQSFNKALDLRPSYTTALDNLEKAKAEMAEKGKRKKTSKARK